MYNAPTEYDIPDLNECILYIYILFFYTLHTQYDIIICKYGVFAVSYTNNIHHI